MVKDGHISLISLIIEFFNEFYQKAFTSMLCFNAHFFLLRVTFSLNIYFFREGTTVDTVKESERLYQSNVLDCRWLYAVRADWAGA